MMFLLINEKQIQEEKYSFLSLCLQEQIRNLVKELYRSLQYHFTENAVTQIFLC